MINDVQVVQVNKDSVMFCSVLLNEVCRSLARTFRALWRMYINEMRVESSMAPELQYKIKVTSFGRAAFSCSAILAPFDILTSPGHWATLGN